MSEVRHHFSQPNQLFLRWILNSGHALTPQMRSALLGELFNSPSAFIAALLNGIIFNGIGLHLTGNRFFILFMIIDCLLVGSLLGIVKRVMTCARQGKETPTGLYVTTAAVWCGLQGAMAFTGMQSNIPSLQIISTASVMALIGMICARSYAAPRYTMTLTGLCHLPFVAGASISGNTWLLLLLLQTPLLMYGFYTVVIRFQTIAMATMKADQDNYHRARHDPLTGLLNRMGLTEALGSQYKSRARFILFYLDLDGFKPINDTFGHDTGDKILQAVAVRLKSMIRANDIVARLGGDEFVIVAADMSAAAGTSLADSIINGIGNEPYHVDLVGAMRLGVSVGFACAPDDGLFGEDLHRKADAALYEAKEAGRGTHRRFMAIAPSKASSDPIAA